MSNRRFFIITGFILLAVLSRILPHPYNFTPLGAIALFGAAYFRSHTFALLVPLVAMWISDLLLNHLVYSSFYEGALFFNADMIWVYASLLVIGLMGLKTLKQVTLPRVIGSAFAASALFFVISNFGVWLMSPMYPPTLGGLISCYTAAIPFFHNTIAGDLIYCATLFGAFEYLRYRKPSLVQSPVAAG